MSSPEPPPAPPPPTRRRGWRVVLLGLIGALALVLPLAQVLRFQVDDLAEARQERARLDPLAEVVSLQLGLIGHDEVAARVLRGRRTLEAERRLRQAEVDRHLARLKATLWAGAWQGARREAGELQTDWNALVLQVSLRQIDEAGSRQGHRLLLEQAVQVMDLVQAQLALPPAALAPNLLLALIDSRRAELDRRILRAQHGAWLLGSVLTATFVLAGVATAGLTRRGAAPDPGGPTGSHPTRRQGPGRRQGDRPAAPTAAELACASIAAARRAAEDERSGG